MVWSFWHNEERRALFAGEAQTSGWFLAKWLTLAFVLESLMIAYVPAEAISQYLGGDSAWGIPAAMAVFALVKRPVFLRYLALGLTGSLAVGLTYQAYI